MLNITLDTKTSILTIAPQGVLEVKDFEEVAKLVDPFIEKEGSLKGLIIYVEAFAGWDSFSALVRHLKFINEHHKKVSHVAFVTDSFIGDIAEHIGSHFVNASVKHFPFPELAQARQWIS
jgi:hypothetical protein